ncbi:uncharacterized protein BP5553_00844 [Venustampulla echinocandica]|uniref:Proteophosphoglycan ppg4 n=1 Tax=Venustampulla echinocandica TaxID=2656787 RepID=A0A370TZC3_9HELO|nr:uncharacterized protein BP5553_00844 [Venustampulla echinocandica]RDL40865.1 hypothetical protein BP5553_00844 [Venustampulla echinocandica]
MGNEQSAPSARRRAQNKLSKPRTNTTGNLLNSKGPAISSRRNPGSNNPSATDLGYNYVSREAGNEGNDRTRWKRISLFRSKSIQGQSQNPEIVAGPDTEIVERLPLDSRTRRHSSANSITLHHSIDDLHHRPPNTRMSLQHVPHTQHHPRLSLVAEVQLTPAEKVESLKGVSLYSQEEHSQLSNTPLPRTTSDTTLYGPIRRRSLQQPGVATRRSYIGDDFHQSLPSELRNGRNDSRQSLPSQLKRAEQLQDYYYHPAVPASSSILSQGVLGQQISLTAPGQRVQTPTDLDYGHIGAFKLGSLRITNGEASPDLSDGGLTGAEEDYLTMGKRRRGASRQLDVSQARQALSSADNTTKPAYAVRAESPLRQSLEGERKPLTIETQLTALDPSLGLFDFKNKYSPGKAVEMANDYAQELTLSPFSFVASPTVSPKLQATSKHMAVEDDLFELEPISPAQDVARIAPRSIDSGYGGVGDLRKRNGPLDVASKPLAKADSGYSSIISLRSLKRDAAPAVPPKDMPTVPAKSPVSRVAASTYSTSPASEVALPTQPSLASIYLQPETTSKPSRNSFVAPLKPYIHELETGTSTLPPQKPEVRTHIGMLANPFRQSLPITLDASNGLPYYNDVSSSSKISTANAESQRRINKIQKPRPESIATPGGPNFPIQAINSSSGRLSLPSMAKKAERVPVGSFPNTTTSTIDLKRARSKDTLGTILSVGSAEVRDEISVTRLHGELPPMHGTIPEYSTSVPESKSLPFWKSFGSKRSSSQTKPSYQISAPSRVDEEQSNFEAHVTSVQAVASSLGKSSHDIPPYPTAIPSGSVTNVRPRSMTSQLEADAATRFQLARSAFQEPQGPNVLRSRKSYDSALVGNRQSRTSATSSSNSRGYPPQSHTNRSARKIHSPTPFKSPVSQSFQKQSVQKADTAEDSILSQQTRQKPPPPVSMQTQRQSSQTIIDSHTTAPPLRKPPIAPGPDRAPPCAPPDSSSDHNEVSDHWAKQKDFWAERRRSAEVVLRAKKSMESIRARTAVTSFDSENESRLSDGMDIRRSESAGPISGTEPFEYGMTGGYRGVDQAPQKSWIGHSTGHHRRQWQERAVSETYHHTYGSSLAPAQDYYQHGPEEDYFPADDQDYDTQMPQDIHARNSSTHQMLGLDPYTGPLGYSYQSGYGLVGSAGTRSVGNLASGCGVDLSHARNFLQRVN